MKAFRELVAAVSGIITTSNICAAGTCRHDIVALQKCLIVAEAELSRLEKGLSSEGVFSGDMEEAVKLTALFSTRMFKGKRVKILVMESE